MGREREGGSWGETEIRDRRRDGIRIFSTNVCVLSALSPGHSRYH